MTLAELGLHLFGRIVFYTLLMLGFLVGSYLAQEAQHQERTPGRPVCESRWNCETGEPKPQSLEPGRHPMTTLYNNPAPELFARSQVITQISTGVELHRVVVSVGEDTVDVTTPAAPHWGIITFGRRFPTALSPDQEGALLELLPPNVGLLHRRGLPRTNRTLVRALGTILVAQRREGCQVFAAGGARLDAPLSGATVLVPARLDANYVFELIMAYLPYEPMTLRIRHASAPYSASRIIFVTPTKE